MLAVTIETYMFLMRLNPWVLQWEAFLRKVNSLFSTPKVILFLLFVWISILISTDFENIILHRFGFSLYAVDIINEICIDTFMQLFYASKIQIHSAFWAIMFGNLLLVTHTMFQVPAIQIDTGSVKVNPICTSNAHWRLTHASKLCLYVASTCFI